MTIAATDTCYDFMFTGISVLNDRTPGAVNPYLNVHEGKDTGQNHHTCDIAIWCFTVYTGQAQY
jgi:hypothetical protein